MKKAMKVMFSPLLLIVILIGVGVWAEHENPHGPTVQDCERMHARSFTMKQLQDMGC